MKKERSSIVFLEINLLLTILLFTVLSTGVFEANSRSVNYVVVVRIRGGIYYGVEVLIDEAISEAEKLNAPLVVLIDTPGGLLKVTEEIIKRIRSSSIPVIGYVYPSGASAWSAGTILLLASHIAAMAPDTLIGAAQPVTYDPITGQYRVINESKIINPIIKLLVDLAEDRGRNKTAIEKFVRENLSLNEKEAYSYGVIEVVARDLDELLSRIKNLRVKLDNGREYLINTTNSVVVEYSGSLRVHVTRGLSDPVVNSLVSTIGVLILLFSILTGNYPLLPLSIGLITLSLLGSGFSTNTTSLVLLIIGSIALAIELLTPGFGVLGLSGIVLIALSIALLPVINPGYLVSPGYLTILFWIGISIGVCMGSLMGFIIYKVLRIRRQPLRIKTDIVGYIGKAIDNIPRGGTGYILIEGEYWRALGLEDIFIGDKVIVVEKDGSLLKVKKYKGESSG